MKKQKKTFKHYPRHPFPRNSIVNCHKKIAFYSYESAMRQLEKVKEKYSDENLNVYYCGFCQKYHIGHNHFHNS